MAYSPPSATYTGRLQKFEELTAQQIAGWRRLLSIDPAFDSPLLTPEFVETVSKFRDDTFIAIVEAGASVQAVLAVHLRPGGLARPLGAPFSDYSGPIIDPSCDISLDTILRLTGIAAYQSAACIVPGDIGTVSNASELEGDDVSHVIRTEPGSNADLLETQRARHSKRFKNFRRLSHQFEREVGPIRFEWGKPDTQTYEHLLDLKGRQFRQSGLVDLTTASQARKFLDAISKSEHAFLVGVWTGDRLVSAHFGIRIGNHFHPWIAAYQPEWSAYSPGNLLLMNVLQHWNAIGLECYDLAAGHDHYKKYFSNASRTTRPAIGFGSGLVASQRKIRHKLWRSLGAYKANSLTGRLQRRMEQIAASEFSTVARLSEFAHAVRVRTVGK